MDILNAVDSSNPTRSKNNLSRRLIKLGEEFGELNEAYLNVTDGFNFKNKSWKDVREEAIDVAIIALDIALLEPDGEENTHEEIYKEIDRKLTKWKNNIERKKQHVDKYC